MISPSGIYILNNTQGLKLDGVAKPDITIDLPRIEIVGQNQQTTKIIEEVGNTKTVNGRPGPYPDLKKVEMFLFLPRRLMAMFLTT